MNVEMEGLVLHAFVDGGLIEVIANNRTLVTAFVRPPSDDYRHVGIAPGGAPFISGSDDYLSLWKSNAEFDKGFVRNFEYLDVDRKNRCLKFAGKTAGIHDDANGIRKANATPDVCRNKHIVLFVTAEKAKSSKSGADEL